MLLPFLQQSRSVFCFIRPHFPCLISPLPANLCSFKTTLVMLVPGFALTRNICHANTSHIKLPLLSIWFMGCSLPIRFWESPLFRLLLNFIWLVSIPTSLTVLMSFYLQFRQTSTLLKNFSFHFFAVFFVPTDDLSWQCYIPNPGFFLYKCVVFFLHYQLIITTSPHLIPPLLRLVCTVPPPPIPLHLLHTPIRFLWGPQTRSESCESYHSQLDLPPHTTHRQSASPALPGPHHPLLMSDCTQLRLRRAL